MASSQTIAKVKTALRISHTALDTEISDTIDACLADLAVCGIAEPDPGDALILNAVKLFVRANFTDDTGKAAAYMQRYDALKACLMTASGYGGANAD